MKPTPRPKPRRPGLLYRLMMSLIGLFDSRLHLSCRSFIRLASEKYERPLSGPERFRQGLHRMMCRICRVQEHRMDQLHELALETARAPEETDEGLSEAAEKRIRSAVLSARPPHRGS